MGSVIQMGESRRDRKRREVYERIAYSALELFMKDGFEETTIDEIAEAADISRRSFFHYFATKEDVVFFWREEFTNALLEVAQGSDDERPVEVMERVLMAVAERYHGSRIIEIDKLIRSTPSLVARRLVHYDAQERSLAEGMAKKWPDREPVGLRLVAIAGVGLLRTTVDAWSGEGYRRPFSAYLMEGISHLRHELGEESMPAATTSRRGRQGVTKAVNKDRRRRKKRPS